MMIVLLIAAIICMLFLYSYITNKRYSEPFDDNTGLIFDNYVTNKGAQRSFESVSKLNMPQWVASPVQLAPGTQPLKKIGAYTDKSDVSFIRTVMQNMFDKTTKLNEPEPKCLSCEGAFNKTIFFKQGPTHYLGYDYKSKTIPLTLNSKPIAPLDEWRDREFSVTPVALHWVTSPVQTVRMLSKASMTADQFMKCCQWKLVLGLSGDANTCSILHMEQDSYLIRLPDDTIIIQPAEIVQGNELARQMATFHLIDGLNTRASVSIMPLSIGKETQVRVVEVAASGKPRIVKYASEHVIDYKASTFYCIDSINEYPIITNRFTVNGNHKCNNSAINQDIAFTGLPNYAGGINSSLETLNINAENLINDNNNFDICNIQTNVANLDKYPIIKNAFPSEVYANSAPNKKIGISAMCYDVPVLEHFQDASNGSSGKHCNKSSGKRLLASSVFEGELTDAELSKAELFQNVSQATNTKPTLFANDFDPKTANIFDSHTGAEFNAILNSGVSQKRNELTDNIFYNLENAKMDPDVNNLLEYNESRYNIYKKENGDFEGKIYDRIKKHTDTVDNLIIDMNNYRVKNIAQDFFFLGDKLIKSRGANNN